MTMPCTDKKSRSEVKREAIIAAAFTTFKQFGVAATSMDKLAEVAQVSKRTVYNHFESKEALVMHLVNQLWMKSIAKKTISYNAESDLESQLQSLILSEIDFMSQQEFIDIARMAVGHLFYNTSGLHLEMERLRKLETAILRWIKAAIADGKLKVECTDFANEQIIHLMKGQCFWSQIIGNTSPLSALDRQRLASETAKMFLCRYQITAQES